MASPFYKIFIRATGEELTGRISGFTYVESLEKDNILSFTFSFDRPQDMPKDFLLVGTELQVQYGYIGGAQSATQLVRVVTRKKKYTTLLKLVIQAADMGILAKKDKKYDDWSGSTASQIVEAIAIRNGFDFEILPTKKQYSQMYQSGRTDFEMVKYLEEIESNPTLRFYLIGNQLFFTERDLNADPGIILDYNNQSLGLIDLSVSETEHTKNVAGNGVIARSTDPDTGELIEVESTIEEKKLGDFDAGVGGKQVVFNVNGAEVATVGESISKRRKSEIDKKQVMLGITPDASEMQGVANTKSTKKALENIKATFVVQGNPQLLADALVTLQGFNDEDNGNWYVCSVKHNLSNGYTSTLELKRNATNADTTKAGRPQNERVDVNKKEGLAEQDTTVPVRNVVFDANGRQVN